MKDFSLILLSLFLLSACSSKRQIGYLQDSANFTTSKIDLSYLGNKIVEGDVLKIDVQSLVPEAAIPYNKLKSLNSSSQQIQLLVLEGYLVDNLGMINFPVLGQIKTSGLNLQELEQEITENSWFSCPAEKELIFSTEFQNKAKLAAASLGFELSQLSSDQGSC